MTLETPNRLRACAVLLFDLDDDAGPTFKFRTQNGFGSGINTIEVSAGADYVADMTLVDSAKVDNDEGAIFVTTDDPSNVDVGGWISPEHTQRGVAALDDMDPYHACLEAIIAGVKGQGWRMSVAVFGMQPSESDVIAGEPLAP